MDMFSVNKPFSVTTIIPVYNSGLHIARAIDSVLGQTRLADEIIVVDDGSSDDTAGVVGGYGQAVRYLHQSNAGVSVARNTGIEAAKSEWIAFLDADDEWFPEKLEKQMALLERNPQLVWAAAGFQTCYSDERSNHTHPSITDGAALLKGREFHDDYFAAFTKGAAGWTGTMVVRRDILQKAGLFRVGQRLAQDIDMWWRIGYQWPGIGYIVEPLAAYHVDTPESSTKRHRDPNHLTELLTRHLQLASDHGKLDMFLPCAQYTLRYYIHRYLLDDRIAAIRGIIVKFDKLLPSRYKSALRLLTICPRATRVCLPALRLINKVVHLPL